MSYLLRHGGFTAGPPDGIAVLWLDRARRLLDGFVAAGADGDLESVAEPVSGTRLRGSPVAAVVLGSWLPQGRRRPTRADRRRFLELRRRHRAAGVELVDWFVLGRPGRVWSMDEEVRLMPP